ncbi:family 78 glycoside hydrolase catalytic domain [Hamadaea tsunoensis]|uniref:family 78 glycoside hydrolase catalytic domain n=1 Tax=Hamadaea tsunoensis TaxID=53368 RepID=UPI000419ED01|nr:family 78 glycoside hydrolase catalytic domain [Hamadaea tsunoensis]
MPGNAVTGRSRAAGTWRAGLRGLAPLLLVVASTALPAAGAAAAVAEVSVAGLRVDYATDPLGIDDTRPSLSWKLTSSVNGERQTAYRVLVASSESRLNAGVGNLWDTGKVTSGDSVAIAYAGAALQATAAYFWKVQAWDANGTVSDWSPTARWETGPLAGADWAGAQWISPTAASSAPRLRKAFTVDGSKVVDQARAYVVGLGFHELHLNGAKIGDRVLAQASTPYDRRVLYSTYDVTAALRSGTNVVGLWLGTGYGASFSQYGFRWLGPKQALMLLDVRYADGTRQTVTTDGTWKWAAGPITAADIYNGETYDARQEQGGWDQPGAADTGWQGTQTVAAPAGTLSAQAMPPLRVTATLSPVKLTQPKPGVYVYDFGQNIAGWERLRVQGAAGAAVRMRTAEEVNADGTLDTTTNRNAAATDTYILAGTGATETYEPRFTYHGFRYVEVTGDPQTPSLASLDARVVHTDAPSTATFTSSDALLNQIWRANRWTIQNNSMSTPTDTPVRDERTPPGMDVQAYQDASTVEFGMAGFYASYLRDLPPGTALPSDGGNAQQPDMGGAGVTLAWTLYQQYGDRATLAATYPAMKRFVDTNAANVPGYIWSTGFGDWCPPDLSANANGGLGNSSAGACTSEVPVVNTALSYLQAVDVAQAAAALGQTADATHFTQLADNIKQAFNARFLNADGAGYADGRQTTSVLPLAFGMVPPADVDAVGTRLVDTILTRNGGHLDTGIFGTRYLMDALAAVGRTDVAMTVLDQTSYPGFGYEIGKGATTAWEEWTYYSSMETHDHAMFAGINSSLYTRLAGIQPAGPGYSAVTVAPRIPAGLAHVAASVDTVRGTVASSWTVTGQQVALDVTVPVGATATVRVPNFGQGQAGVSPAGAVQVAATGTETQFSVGSGTWHFTGTVAPTPSTVLPGDWTLCAQETGTCSTAGTVAFGAQGRFAYATTAAPVACGNTVFGDPVFGVAKACYVTAAPPTGAGWQRCAGETGSCSFAGTATVAYGAGGKFAYATVGNGTSCTNAVFGDPVPGTGKACYLHAPPPAVATWTPCAAETKTCAVSGSHLLAYGAGGRYFYGTFGSDTVCGNAVFGDPAPGQAKTCYLQ